MNIAIFTNNYLPNPYGVTTSIESFKDQFEKNGHTVFIFAPESGKYIDKNKNVFRYPSLDIKYRIKFPIPIPYSSEIDKIIENLKIDIVHSQHPNLLGDVALKLAKKKSVPLVFTWHTLYNKYTHYVPLIPEGISSKLAIKNAVEYANKADQVIVPTISVKEIIKKWGVKNKQITDIPTGVDSQYFQNSDPDGIRKKLGINNSQKIILSISRLTEEKNVIFLLSAIIKVLRKNKRSVFVFGGEGYLKNDMQKIVKESEIDKRVIFPGIIKKGDIKNYFQAADVFVYASKSETQGTIITEAMYSTLPIVAVDATGIQDLIDNKKTGILVPEDEDEFAEAVDSLIKDSNRARELGENAKLVADEKYTSEVCANRMLKTYKETIEKFKKKYSN